MTIKIKKDGDSVKFGHDLLSEKECLDKIFNLAVNAGEYSQIAFMDKVSATGRYSRIIKIELISEEQYQVINYSFDRELVIDRKFWEKLCDTLMNAFHLAGLYRLEDQVKREKLANYILNCFDNNIDASRRMFFTYPATTIANYMISYDYDLLHRLNNERMTGSKIPSAAFYGLSFISLGGLFMGSDFSFLQSLVSLYMPFTFFISAVSQDEYFEGQQKYVSNDDYQRLVQLKEDINGKIKRIAVEKRHNDFLEFISKDKVYLEKQNDPRLLCVKKLLEDLEKRYKDKPDDENSILERFKYLKELIKIEVVLYYEANISLLDANAKPISREFIQARLDYLGLDDELLENRYVEITLEDIYYIIDHPYEGYEYEVMRLFSELVNLLKELNFGYENVNSETYAGFMSRVRGIKNLLDGLKLKGAMSDGTGEQPVESLEQEALTEECVANKSDSNKVMAISPVNPQA